MYNKISQEKFPYVQCAVAAANYVRKCYTNALSFNKYLIPDLYAECIAAGWEEYTRGGNGDAVFRGAARAGRRYLWHELKVHKYSFAHLLKREANEERFSIKRIARTIRVNAHGRLSLRQCVKKAYIVRERLMGRSFASIARELQCDDANVLYHFNSVVAILTSGAKLKEKSWQRKGKRGRRRGKSCLRANSPVCS